MRRSFVRRDVVWALGGLAPLALVLMATAGFVSRSVPKPEQSSAPPAPGAVITSISASSTAARQPRVPTSFQQLLPATWMHMVSKVTGWGVDFTHILRTTDGGGPGRTSHPRNLPGGARFEDGLFLDAETAWVPFGVSTNSTHAKRGIIATTDGGTTWRTMPLQLPPTVEPSSLPPPCQRGSVNMYSSPIREDLFEH